MAIETSIDRSGAGSLLRAEYVLAALAVLSLALVPIHITTIYSGLPAHPLFLHVPVILIPVATVWAVVLVARPAWFMRSGVWLGILTVVALAGTFLTVGAGKALQSALHLTGGFGPGALVARHAHAGELLRDFMILFTGAVIVALFAHRVAAGMVSGISWLDSLARRPAVLILLRIALVVLAIVCAYFVFHTGDLGAKAVWQGRLSGGGPGGGGGPVNQLFGPGGG
ncbi:MAG TPA: hypothetical protein VMA76_05995 [Solirubrobacteraceae bacterium]|nr:hypothetical protein [Solirubrobacteraceae bacterium]